MLESGKFLATACFCLPSLLWEGRPEWNSRVSAAARCRIDLYGG